MYNMKTRAMKKLTGFRLSVRDRAMLDDIRDLFQNRLSYTQIVVMGINSLYAVAREVRKQAEDPHERTVLFEWVRTTRDVICEQDVKWNLEALRETWESSRRQEYANEIRRAAEFLKRGRQFKDDSGSKQMQQ